MRFDDATRERYRKALLKKGHQVATLLAEVLAGKDRRRELAALPDLVGRPGMRPEEKLRAYLDLIESRRLLLVAGDDRFGRCDACGAELAPLALDEMPWADRCRACAAR
jgi:RNA polymerase-binding transcription factor DksA